MNQSMNQRRDSWLSLAPTFRWVARLGKASLNRFNGFPPRHRKTVETVQKWSAALGTLLKKGVNERAFDKGGARPIIECTPAFTHRFVKFGVVGAGGIIVQVAMLAVLLRFVPAHYLIDTALAVEAAILHNFAWHRRWTWADRPKTNGTLALLRFNAANGATSLAGNLVLMFVFVGVFKLNPFVANLITIAICSIANFALADRCVFV
jgi:putative flippase GtrA